MNSSPQDLVQELYIAAYGRPADPAGLQYWTNVLNQNGNNIGAIVSNFTNSTEANNLYGTISSSNLPTVLNNIYENLFNRPIDQVGLQYWENTYNQYHMSVGDLAYAIMQGAQNSDVTVIDNKIATAQTITNYLASNPNISITQGEVPLLDNFLKSVSTSVPSLNDIQNFLNNMNNQNIVQSLYLAFYDRPADPAGLQYWSNVLSQNANNINAILPSFASSQESATLYGNVQPTPDLNTLINTMDNYFNTLFTTYGLTPPNLQGLNNAVASYYQDYASGNLTNVNNDINNIINQFDNLMIYAANQYGIKLTVNDLQPLNALLQNTYQSGQFPTESNFINAFDSFITNAAKTNNETITSSDLSELNSILSSAYQSEFSTLQSYVNSVDNMINTIYQNLFGRPADSSGLQYWQNIYTHTPNMNPGLLAYDILHSATGSDLNTIQHKIAIANEVTLLYQNNPTAYNSSTVKGLISGSTLPSISDVANLLNLPTTSINTGSSSTGTSSSSTPFTVSNPGTYNGLTINYQNGIIFSNLINPNNPTTTNIISIQDSSNFTTDLNTAIAKTTPTTPYSYFIYEGNTYIVDHGYTDAGSTTFNSGVDAEVEIVGSHIPNPTVVGGHVTFSS
ncbi:protein of unknown function [Desulfurella multipotens]|uniref:DUF4214 domain-containing protein n=1 Tax=Desulfurella multipotens TaxID=79269 RepID=A0A1G6QV50_9BACT|nr:DUF4214 domain-containing protein [Desulfurella multipotens]SDC96201.1 protein of unknown function [Desulfurella multipotens]